MPWQANAHAPLTIHKIPPSAPFPAYLAPVLTLCAGLAPSLLLPSLLLPSLALPAPTTPLSLQMFAPVIPAFTKQEVPAFLAALAVQAAHPVRPAWPVSLEQVPVEGVRPLAASAPTDSMKPTLLCVLPAVPSAKRARAAPAPALPAEQPMGWL